MPKKKAVEVIKVGDRYRIIVPLDLREKEGQRTKWYRKKATAEVEAARLQNDRDSTARGFHRLPRPDQALVLKALEKAGGAQQLWESIEYHVRQRPAKEIEMPELIRLATLTKERSGKSDHYVECFESACKQFALLFTGRASEAQPAHVEQWIHSNAGWSTNTKVDYLRHIRTLFSFAVKNGYSAFNPAMAVEVPNVPDHSPSILTVDECQRLMTAACERDRKLLRYLALCLFGGLRPSEALRIRKENIKDNHVEVFGKRVRSRNRRLVTINPTLRAWLDEGGDMPPKNLRKRLMAVRAMAQVNWTQDCLRHSFVSYHYALNTDTAREAGHSESVLHQHYREMVSRSDAERFWAIRPASLTPCKVPDGGADGWRA